MELLHYKLTNQDTPKSIFYRFNSIKDKYMVRERLVLNQTSDQFLHRWIFLLT